MKSYQKNEISVHSFGQMSGMEGLHKSREMTDPRDHPWTTRGKAGQFWVEK